MELAQLQAGPEKAFWPAPCNSQHHLLSRGHAGYYHAPAKYLRYVQQQFAAREEKGDVANQQFALREWAQKHYLCSAGIQSSHRGDQVRVLRGQLGPAGAHVRPALARRGQVDQVVVFEVIDGQVQDVQAVELTRAVFRAARVDIEAVGLDARVAVAVA